MDSAVFSRGVKVAAARLSVTPTEYQELRDARQKWCCGCRAWHPRSEFFRSRSEPDGLTVTCRIAKNRGKKADRDPQKERSRGAVYYEVKMGRLANPNTVACMDCGHFGEEMRHEYDHYLGYAPEHKLAVQPVCTICHADREIARSIESKARGES